MGLKCIWGSHFPWKHWPLKYFLNPTELAASVYSSKSGEVNTVEKGLPHGQVLKISLLSGIWWKRLGIPRVRLIIRWKKVLPGTTALHAHWRVTIRSWSSTKRTERPFVKEVSKSRVRCTLSSVRRASMRVESNSMPINSSTWEGSRVLEATTGAWTDIKKRSKVLKEDRHFKRLGSAKKKLSRIWSTCFNP